MKSILISIIIIIGSINSVLGQETEVIKESIPLYADDKTVIKETVRGVYHNYLDDDEVWKVLHFDCRESIISFYENLVGILSEDDLEDDEYYEVELTSAEDGYRIWVKRYFGETDIEYRNYWSDTVEVSIGFDGVFYVNKNELEAYIKALKIH